ncbi:asparagine synthase (glutamine-hydrolyzing) [Candidatus Pacearchaeota archaeon]|nr:asparagine synthase (glutamine-hydrolyzing) [Candidatus Pacearchaeota archaeon]
MCGIMGFTWADKTLVKKMGDVLAHRGPDDSGFFITQGISLGHRRLSIIDTSQRGHQPMYNENNSIVVVFNGEIWNYKSLRKALEQKKHKFKSDSDTEVLVHGYEEYGESLCEKLEGMFSFALWDARQRKLLLARDRLGKKPLYYCLRNGQCIFGSEIKALLEHTIPRQIDMRCLSDYLSLRFSSDGRTMFEGIRKLEPGTLLIYQKRKAQIHRYWKLPGFEVREQPDVQKADALIEHAVGKRLMSDVPLGVFLSGGLDSSTLVAYMRRFTKRIKTFSVGFGDVSDETKYAKLIADKFKTEHTEIKLDANILSVLPQVVWHFDEPLADPAALPTYLLCKEVSKKVKVALSGEGGDEVFGGYHTYNSIDHLRAFHTLPLLVRKYFLSPAFRASSHLFQYPKKQMLALAGEISQDARLNENFKKLFYFPFTLEEKKKLLGEKAMPDAFDEILNQKTDLRDAALEYYFKEWLPNDLLMKADKMSMAHSLEVRTPFLDTELIRYFTGLDYSETRNRSLFRRTVGKLLPEEIMKKKKQGFTLPLSEWFSNGEIVERIRPHIVHLKERGIFNSSYLDELLEHPERFRNDHKLWVLLNFELWCQMYLDKKPVEKVRL